MLHSIPFVQDVDQTDLDAQQNKTVLTTMIAQHLIYRVENSVSVRKNFHSMNSIVTKPNQH